MALKTDENTTLEIRAPEGFSDSLQLSTELSLFFLTNDTDGLLIYIGPEATANTVVMDTNMVLVIVITYM